MTRLATLAVFTFVCVVVAMTCDAFGFQFDVELAFAVTGIARRGRMRALQSEMRIATMIECRFLPTGFIVTALAFIAIAAAMHIVDRMAGNAGGRRIFVAFARMARAAADLLVIPF